MELAEIPRSMPQFGKTLRNLVRSRYEVFGEQKKGSCGGGCGCGCGCGCGGGQGPQFGKTLQSLTRTREEVFGGGGCGCGSGSKCGCGGAGSCRHFGATEGALAAPDQLLGWSGDFDMLSDDAIGGSGGLTVAPQGNAAGSIEVEVDKKDPCKVTLILHVYIDEAASVQHGCVPNYLGMRPMALQDIDQVERYLNEAIAPWRQLACPCSLPKKPKKGATVVQKKCEATVKIRISTSPDGDPGKPRPTRFFVRCDCKDADPTGETRFGESMWICLNKDPKKPSQPVPGVPAHEMGHALGIGYEGYTRTTAPGEKYTTKAKKGWEGTIMGEAGEGKRVTLKDMCTILSVSRACAKCCPDGLADPNDATPDVPMLLFETPPPGMFARRYTRW
jgi:hypothetical protein